MNKIVSVFILLVAFSSLGKAQLTLSNWNITQDALSFDISGTFTSSQLPASNLGVLWLAEIGNAAWINNATNPSSLIFTGTIDGHDVTINNPRPVVFSYNGGPSGTDVGAYLEFEGMMPQESVEFDFTDGSLNEVNIHLEITSLGKYNPSAINFANLELYWGGWASSAVDGIAMNLAAVPEPSTYAGFAGLATLGFVVWCRRRRI